MAQLALPRPKIPTKSPQPARGKAARRAPAGTGRAARGHVFVNGTGRPATLGEGRPVIELAGNALPGPQDVGPPPGRGHRR